MCCHLAHSQGFENSLAHRQALSSPELSLPDVMMGSGSHLCFQWVGTGELHPVHEARMPIHIPPRVSRGSRLAFCHKRGPVVSGGAVRRQMMIGRFTDGCFLCLFGIFEKQKIINTEKEQMLCYILMPVFSFFSSHSFM